MKVYVQYSDATKATIISSFGCPQDPNFHPNQETIDSSDPRYQAFVNPASTLAGAQSAKIAALTASYQAAIQQPVSYTSEGGATKTYQADAGSIANLTQMLLAFQSSQTVPVGFYWVSLDNAQVPFSYADMQGLANALGTQGAVAFRQLQTLKGKVNTAATVDAVQTIEWA